MRFHASRAVGVGAVSVPLGRSQQGPPNPHAAQGPHPHGHLDSYDHDHGHSGGQFNRLRYALAGLFGSHSHNVVDQIDDALEADARGRRALWISLAIPCLQRRCRRRWWWSPGRWPCSATPCTTSPMRSRRCRCWSPSRLSAGRPTTGSPAGMVGRRPGRTVRRGDDRAVDSDRRVRSDSALASSPAGDSARAVAAAAVVGFLGNEAVAVYRIRVGRAIGSAALVSDGLMLAPTG